MSAVPCCAPCPCAHTTTTTLFGRPVVVTHTRGRHCHPHLLPNVTRRLVSHCAHQRVRPNVVVVVVVVVLVDDTCGGIVVVAEATSQQCYRRWRRRRQCVPCQDILYDILAIFNDCCCQLPLT